MLPLPSWRPSSRLSPKGAAEEGRFPALLPGGPVQSLLFHLLLSSSSSVRLTRYFRYKSLGCPGPSNHPSVSCVAQPDVFHGVCSARLNLLHPHLHPRISLTFESSVLQTEPFSFQWQGGAAPQLSCDKGRVAAARYSGVSLCKQNSSREMENFAPRRHSALFPLPSPLLDGPHLHPPAPSHSVPAFLPPRPPLHLLLQTSALLQIPHPSVRSVSSSPTESKITTGSHYLGKPRENQHRAAAFNEPFYNSEPACAILPQPPSVHHSQMAPVGRKTGVAAEGHGVPRENGQQESNGGQCGWKQGTNFCSHTGRSLLSPLLLHTSFNLSSRLSYNHTPFCPQVSSCSTVLLLPHNI